jgi:D-inositol-3-phosphate glycosyltransferase
MPFNALDSQRRVAFISMHGCPVARLGERETGGMNVFLLQTAKELGKRGLSVDVYTRYHDPSDPQVIELGPNSRVIHVRAGLYFEEKESLYWYLPQFIRNVMCYSSAEQLEYHLVHSHYWLSGRAGMFLAKRWNVPHVASFHTLASLKQQAYVGAPEPEMRAGAERKVMEAADLILAYSDHERDAMARLYGVARPRIEVLPAGVDTDVFRPMDREACKRELGLEGKKVVLYVGRVEPIKGLDLLLNAVTSMGDRRDLKLVMVGGKEGEPEVVRLKSRIQELGLAEMVWFVGPVKQERLPVFYNAAEALVLPSHYESFGLVALESLACGTPVVASRVGGLPTFLKDGETGYLVPWRSPDSFADRLEVLLTHPALRESMGRAGRQKALSLGWDRLAERLEGKYSRLLSPLLSAAAGS